MTYATHLNQSFPSLEAKLNQLIQRLDRLESSLQHLAQPKPNATHSQVACATALVGFTRVINALLNHSAATGISIAHNQTLHIEVHEEQTALTLQTYAGHPLFSGRQVDGDWQITLDRLSEDEKAVICQLPQSQTDYSVKASSQALVRHLHHQLPDHLKYQDDLTFVWTEEGESKYEFEIVTLPSGAQVIQGFDPEDDELVFDALFVLGHPPEIRSCAIPLDELELLVQEPWNWEIETAHTLKIPAFVPAVKFIASERELEPESEREQLAV